MSNKHAEDALAKLYNDERETWQPIFAAIASRGKAKSVVDLRRLKSRIYQESGVSISMRELEERFEVIGKKGLGQLNRAKSPTSTSTFAWSPKVDHQGVLQTLVDSGGVKVAPAAAGRPQPGQIPIALSSGKVINLTKQELQELSEIAQNL